MTHLGGGLAPPWLHNWASNKQLTKWYKLTDYWTIDGVIMWLTELRRGLVLHVENRTIFMS